MNPVELLVAHGLDLALGTTLVLAVAAALVALQRDPLYAQRAGEAGVAAALAFCALVFVPLPRPLAGWRPAPPAVVANRGAPTATDTRTAPTPTSPEIQPGVVEHALAALLRDEPPATPASRAEARHDDGRLGSGGAGAAPRPPPGEAPVGGSPPPTGPRSADIDVGRWLARLVVTGSLLCLAWLLTGTWRLARLLRAVRPAPDWVAALAGDTLAVSDARLVVSARPIGPFCVGLRRPLVVLPAALCDPARRDDLRAVLLHELGHARSRDGRGRLLLNAALPALWWHPLFWWLRGRVHLAAELRADDLAAGLAGKRDYARRLIDLSAEALHLGPAPLAAPSAFGTPHDLTRRIEMLMHRTHRLAPRCSPLRRLAHTTLAMGLLVLAGGVFGATSASAQDSAVEQQLRLEQAQLREQVATLRTEREAMTSHLEQLRSELGSLQRELESLRATKPDDARLGQLRALGYLGSAIVGPNAASSTSASPDAGTGGSADSHDPLLSALLDAIGPGASPDRPASASLLLGTHDILTLLEQFLDHRAALEMAQVELVRSRALNAEQYVSDGELRRAELEQQSLTRKVALTRALLSAEMHALDVEIAGCDGADAASRAQRLRLLARRDLIASALEGGLADGGR